MAYEVRGTQRDIDFIDKPEDWPNGMVLCVKRYDGKNSGGWPTFGVIVNAPDYRYTVFEGEVGTMAQTIGEAQRHVYKSAAEIVADGWMVD